MLLSSLQDKTMKNHKETFIFANYAALLSISAWEVTMSSLQSVSSRMYIVVTNTLRDLMSLSTQGRRLTEIGIVIPLSSSCGWG